MKQNIENTNNETTNGKNDKRITNEHDNDGRTNEQTQQQNFKTKKKRIDNNKKKKKNNTSQTMEDKYHK